MGKNGGARPGAGRKSKAEEMGLAALLNRCFTEEQREECIGKLVEDAKSLEFNVRDSARKLLLAYTFGQPAAKHEVTGKDGGPMEGRFVVEVVSNGKRKKNSDK